MAVSASREWPGALKMLRCVSEPFAGRTLHFILDVFPGRAGAIMIGGGAALSAVAGALLSPGSDAAPLIWIMFLSASAGVLAILYVIQRERELGRGS